MAESILKINRVQYSGGVGKTDEDFIEILNASSQEINLKGYRLVKRALTSSSDTTIKSWASDAFVPPNGLYLWANSKNGFAESLKADTATTQTISDGNQIAIRYGKENEGMIIDSVNWKKDEEAEEPKDDTVEPKNYTGKIEITELFPHPLPNQEEYIELYNPEKEDLDLENYILRDGSKTGKYIFLKDNKIKSLGYLVVYKKDFKFALNDSGNETVSLYDPNENLVDSATYSTSKEDYSWSFDGSKWRLTKLKTPGTKNQFENPLPLNAKKDKKIYKNMYADFTAKTDARTQKVVWDFGDGHKSYLEKTRHKYEKTGNYIVTVKVTGDGEDTLDTFTIEVIDYPKEKVEIISILANPAGKDTLGEKITVKNNSKKKINLKGWSIATGTKNLINHPITKDFKLKPSESRQLTRKYSLFTLGNQKSKIELRMPNGKTIQKLKYDRTGNAISDDELYEKDATGWNWIEPPEDIEEEAPTEKKLESPPGSEEVLIAPENAPATTPENNSEDIDLTDQEFFSSLGKSSQDPAWQEKQKNKIVLLSAGTNVVTPKILLENQPRVLGISTQKHTAENNDRYSLLKNFWVKINSGMNWILNKR